MTRYTVTTCPGCGRRMAVNGRTTCVRASRTRLDDSAASWGTARDRVETEAPHRVSSLPEPAVVTPVTVKPMPVRRRRLARALAGGG